MSKILPPTQPKWSPVRRTYQSSFKRVYSCWKVDTGDSNRRSSSYMQMSSNPTSRLDGVTLHRFQLALLMTVDMTSEGGILAKSAVIKTMTCLTSFSLPQSAWHPRVSNAGNSKGGSHTPFPHTGSVHMRRLRCPSQSKKGLSSGRRDPPLAMAAFGLSSAFRELTTAWELDVWLKMRSTEKMKKNSKTVYSAYFVLLHERCVAFTADRSFSTTPGTMAPAFLSLRISFLLLPWFGEKGETVDVSPSCMRLMTPFRSEILDTLANTDIAFAHTTSEALSLDAFRAFCFVALAESLAESDANMETISLAESRRILRTPFTTLADKLLSLLLSPLGLSSASVAVRRDQMASAFDTSGRDFEEA
mmetsp:Transcript_23759/g.51901  ORF Transcript_23759/g.51901 Transcript_23759/m.51901 type:complete len:361 (-) Transcript_23759:697-1779(-)